MVVKDAKAEVIFPYVQWGWRMDETAIIVISLLVIAAILGVAAFFVVRKRRTEKLRNRFGPEYDHAVQETGDRSRAEATLEEREERVERLHIRPLTPEDVDRFGGLWQKVQTLFVDDPKGAVTEADQVLRDVMSKRGYPVTDFEQRAADISVEHPRVVERYRAGHEIAVRHAQGQASTEDLRQAMIHYRVLFLELVGGSETASAEVVRKQGRS